MIYLVDNASTLDNILDISEYTLQNNISFIPLTYNGWFAAGNNVALQKAISNNCSYVMLLNPDVFIDDINFFKELISWLDLYDMVWPLTMYHKKRNLIYSAGWTINPFTMITTMVGKWKKIDSNYTKTYATDRITWSCIMMKIETLVDVWPIPEEYFLYYEETDWCLSARKQWKKIGFVWSTRCFHNVSNSVWYLSKTQIYYMIRNHLIFIKKRSRFIYLPMNIVIFFIYFVAWYLYLLIKQKSLSWIKCVFTAIFDWFFNEPKNHKKSFL